MRRPEPLHPAAFLIDQCWSRAPQGRPDVVDQVPQSFGAIDVPAEQNEAPRLRVTKKSSLLGCKDSAGKAGDESTHLAPLSSRGAKRSSDER
jgi:hypothetical protein